MLHCALRFTGSVAPVQPTLSTPYPTTVSAMADPASPASAARSAAEAGYEIVDFDQLDGVPCPCGVARRGLADVPDFPGTIHVTSISRDARKHYHKRLTEVYYFLECGPDAQMELDDRKLPVREGMCVMIRPGTRHRALGEMKVLIVVLPKFDPHDEWFD